jgi:hypothetical protein
MDAGVGQGSEPLAFSPTSILLVVRQNSPIQWHSLCEKLGLSPMGDTHTYMLRRTLEELKSAGLVSFESEHEHTEIPGPIKITPLWSKIQVALDISLVQLAKQASRGSMVVTPVFGEPRARGVTIDLFVLMPFRPELKPIYDDHIVSVADSLGLRSARADDLFTTDVVVGDIWRSINAAKVIVADCTGRNPNVFYELGMAHTIGKPVILITQDADDVPFDIRHIRYIRYEYTPRGMKTMEEQLEKTLKTLLEL